MAGRGAPPRSDEWWRAKGIRAARNRNRRTAQAAPLLAAFGLLPQEQPADAEGRLRRQYADDEARLRALEERHFAAAQRDEAEVALVVGAAVHQTLRARWARWGGPHTSTYEADYWHTRKRELGLCGPGCSC